MRYTALIFVTLVSLCAYLYTAPLLVIVLMVKNEASVIYETLQPFVDAGIQEFLIFDTGSIDDTVAVVKKFFIEKDIRQGKVIEEAFIDFATSRNRALAYAEVCFPEAHFMLMPDAEWYMHDVQTLIQFCTTQKDEIQHKAYLVHIVGSNLDFYTPRLIRCHTGVKFIGVVHEVLDCVVHKKVPASVVFELRVGDKGKEKTQRRWLRDCELLLQEYKQNPLDPRTVFYIAQTYMCLGEYEQAALWYEQRIEMKGWDEENFMAHYKLAQVYEYLGMWDKALYYYLKAHSLRPHRAEPLIRVAQHYWDTRDSALCFLFSQRAVALPYPTQDILFIEKELYDYVRYDLLGRSAWYVGEYEEGERAVRQALQVCPCASYLQTNLAWYLSRSSSV